MIFYFPDRESIVTEQNFEVELSTVLDVLRSQESKKVVFKKCPSVRLYSVTGLGTILWSRSTPKRGLWNKGINISRRFFVFSLNAKFKGGLPWRVSFFFTLKGMADMNDGSTMFVAGVCSRHGNGLAL